jgi:hypothetical protein
VAGDQFVEAVEWQNDCRIDRPKGPAQPAGWAVGGGLIDDCPRRRLDLLNHQFNFVTACRVTIERNVIGITLVILRQMSDPVTVCCQCLIELGEE